MEKEVVIVWPDSQQDLSKLERKNGMSIKTSDGKLFGGPNDFWGRDTAITSMDLIETRPDLAEKGIFSLARMQGTTNNPNSGERPGRIITEHREIYNNQELELLPKIGLSLASKLLWKEKFSEYTTYFSSDTTPLFINAVYIRQASQNQRWLNRVDRRGSQKSRKLYRKYGLR
jgi:glycogen debranching enzyme